MPLQECRAFKAEMGKVRLNGFGIEGRFVSSGAMQNTFWGSRVPIPFSNCSRSMYGVTDM